MFSIRIRTAIAAVVAIAVVLGLAAQAQAAVDYYTIQAKPPGGSRDHRLRYVGVDNPSTEERVKLFAGSKIHAGQLWRLQAVQLISIDESGKASKSVPAYRFINGLTGNCLSYKLPWQDGTGVFQQASGCRAWALIPRTNIITTGAPPGPARITDKTGQANGFAMKMIDKCMDLPGGEIALGTPLQLSRCTGATNQTFLIKIRLRDHRAGAVTGGG